MAYRSAHPFRFSGQITTARDLKARLEFCLIEKLVTGRLLATGYSGQNSLDEAASAIAADRWRTLVPDFQRSEARSRGTWITGVLVFKKLLRPKHEAQPKARFAGPKIRAWYKHWVEEHVAAGSRPSRESDLEACCAAFGSPVPREVLRSLRRELAPDDWKRIGRRKGQA